MARPTTPKLWASDPAAISNEPPLSYRQAGFSAAQPPADYMNWALQNIYQWIDYFDGAGVGGGGGLTITFDSSRPRIQLPFALPADNQLAAIEVFKRETAAVGGISFFGSFSERGCGGGEIGVDTNHLRDGSCLHRCCSY